MPFIQLPALAGILSLLAYSPETAKPLTELAEVLLRSERAGSSLTSSDRELIAAFVSFRNQCSFCTNSHAAACAAYEQNSLETIATILADPESANITEKLKALLNIAGKVKILGKAVTQQDIDRAKNAGATDQEIHDTILIAAAFCMYNRYVDGLSTVASTNPNDYIEMGKIMANVGYVR